MEEDLETKNLISTIQQVLCILNVFNTITNKIQFSLMIHCGFKIKEKTGLDKCYPYDLLELKYLRGRPNSLKITVSDMTSINRPCCVIPKRECVTFNHTTDVVKRKKLQFWLLTLQNVDRNS